MINDIDAIRRRSTPSRKNAEHDVFGSPCGLSVEAEAHIFDSNGNKLLAVGRVERPHGKALRKVVNSSASSIERMKGMSADERRKVKARERITRAVFKKGTDPRRVFQVWFGCGVPPRFGCYGARQCTRHTRSLPALHTTPQWRQPNRSTNRIDALTPTLSGLSLRLSLPLLLFCSFPLLLLLAIPPLSALCSRLALCSPTVV